MTLYCLLKTLLKNFAKWNHLCHEVNCRIQFDFKFLTTIMKPGKSCEQALL